MVLIDVKAVKPSHDRTDRAALIIDDMQLPAVTVTAIYMLQVEQLLLVTFATDEVFQEAVTKLRRGVPWGAAAGRHVYGWPTTDSLLQVRLTNVHPDIPVDRLTASCPVLAALSWLTGWVAETPSSPTPMMASST